MQTIYRLFTDGNGRRNVPSRESSPLTRQERPSVAAREIEEARGYGNDETGVVAARPWLVCQRCLNAFEWRLESAFRVAFVASDEQSAQVPPEYDAVLAQHGRASGVYGSHGARGEHDRGDCSSGDGEASDYRTYQDGPSSPREPDGGPA